MLQAIAIRNLTENSRPVSGSHGVIEVVTPGMYRINSLESSSTEKSASKKYAASISLKKRTKIV